ncbi:hypothetical protein JTB14_009745 [Gonioctena quinquepunctata]|nr:hypothetical protein JTB14_009745 [Gonioctena quinquepunctata]
MNMYENCQYPLIVSYETEYQNTKEEGKESGRKDPSKDQDDNDELENLSCSSETGKENELDKNKNYSNSNDNLCQRRSSQKGQRVVGCRWVFEKKISETGEVSEYKARLVAHRFSQVPGDDFEETSSPVIRYETIRLLLAHAIHNGMISSQMDIKTAFYDGDIDVEENYLALSQEQYIYKLLEKYNFLNCKPTSTPMDCGTRLEKAKPGDTRTDKELYQTKIGSLLYLAMGTGPDIAHAVNVLSQYCVDPSIIHNSSVHHLFRYLRGSMHYKLIDKPVGSPSLKLYSDASFANSLDDRRSYTGFVAFYGGSVVC